MVDLIHGLSAEVVARNLARAREAIAAAGRDPGEVEILAAVKYLPAEELAALADGGVTVVGENRAQELEAKVAAAPGRFIWDFIGQLQSRKVKDVLPHVRYIHSVASESALAQLGRHGGPDTRILIEVNVAGEPGKGGIDPDGAPCLPGPLPGGRGGTDDDAAVRRGPRGEPSVLRGAAAAGRGPRAASPVDGDQPGLRGRGPGGGDDRASRYEPVPRYRLSAS